MAILLLSLGNPGPISRHSVGHSVVGQLQTLFELPQLVKVPGQPLSMASGSGLVVCKSETLMNDSGAAVRAVLGRSISGPHSVLVVVYDDFEVDCGKVRFTKSKLTKTESHNGLQDVNRRLLGHDRGYQYLKLGVGIGPKPQNSTSNTMSKWILSTDMSLSDKLRIREEAMPVIVAILETLIERDAALEESGGLRVADVNPEKIRSRLSRAQAQGASRERTPVSVLHQ